MKIGKKIIAGAMLSCGAAFSFSEVQAQTCVVPPSCEELGYKQTEADCKGLDVVLKCPTDMSKMACLGSSVSQDVSVGAILYGDGTVSSELISGKQPIGVVFDVINRLAVALNDVKYDGSAGSGTMLWSGCSDDTPGLENCEDYSTVITTCGTDGRVNMDAILASDYCNDRVAYAVNIYQPSGCSADFCKAGKWFVPSLRELRAIYSVKSSFQDTLTFLSTVGATSFKTAAYWSSTEKDESSMWILNMTNGNYRANLKDSGYDNYSYVRPVVKF